MSDVREVLNLEKIELKGCIKLPKINPLIGLLKKLDVLNLRNCKNLVSLPNTILGLNYLDYLDVFGCSKLCLVEAPILSQSTSSFIKKMLYSRAQRDSVSYLLLSSPTFPSSLTCLRELDLSFCNLVQIPDAIGKLSCLEHLNLEGNNFTTLPNLNNLFRLYHLNLQHCKRFKRFLVLLSQTNFPLETC